MAINNIGSVLNGCITTLVELKNIEDSQIMETFEEIYKEEKI